MLFALKKIIAGFFMPLSISFILFILALFFLFVKKYNKTKIFLTLGLVWTFLIAYAPFSNAFVKPLEAQYPSYLNIDIKIKYVLVLGSGHNSNENISDVSQLSRVALTRLSEGIRIYKKLEDAKLIVSGYGGTDKIAHAFMAKNAAISLGVDEKDILTQENAKDTFEEALSAKEIIQNEKLILVTSATHMPRAVKIFKSQGVDVIPAPTYYLAKTKGDIWSLPKGSNIIKTEASFHEYLGILWFEIVQKIRLYLN